MSDALDQLFNGTLQPKITPEIQPTKHSVKLDAGDELKELPIDILQDFPADKHPFKPYTDERLEALRQDIIERGIIQPLIVRQMGAFQYEIVSGHNRRNAARQAGYTVLPCVVRQLTDDEALLQMISTNLQQRSNLRFSEKAFAYRMQMEAMKRQAGRPGKDNVSQLGTQKRSDQLLAEQAGESRNQIQRYIRLTYLIPELLDRVDEKQIGFTIGETLSYLEPKNQRIVENFFLIERKLGIDQRTADQLRELESAGELTEEMLGNEFLSPPVKPLKKISIRPFKKWFNSDISEKEMQQTILTALDFYFNNKKGDIKNEHKNK